jgi:hypothetical protein
MQKRWCACHHEPHNSFRRRSPLSTPAQTNPCKLLSTPPSAIYPNIMATAGPSRGPDLWQPSRYLEPNQPDNEEVLEQAAYQAAVTKLGGDARARRYKPRRTVDYMGPMTKWRLDAKLKAVEYMAAIHPNPSDLIGVSCTIVGERR